MQDAAGSSPAIMPGPITDDPPPGFEPVTTPGTEYPEPPVGNFPGDPAPEVGGGAVDGPGIGGPAGVIACGIEAGIEVCRYNPANPDQTTGPFTCFGNMFWHHCIEPFYPAPSLPALPLPVRPKPVPCAGWPKRRMKEVTCTAGDLSIERGDERDCFYDCTDGQNRRTTVPVDSDCPKTIVITVPE